MIRTAKHSKMYSTGPLFHRWLPNGRQDALFLNTRIPHTKLEVWFERWGYTGFANMIEFDPERKEVNEDLMKSQGKLNAGHLHGLLQIDNISNEQMDVLKRGQEDGDIYKHLGQTIQKAIYDPIAHLLSLLKIRYGQYWINGIEKWNSTKESIGSYCMDLNIHWFCGDTREWKRFGANDLKRVDTAIMPDLKDFKLFLSKDDWDNIPEILKHYRPESIAGKSMSRAHEYLGRGELRYAIIDAVTALELALYEFFTKKANESIKEELARFQNNVSISQQMAVVGILLDLPNNKIQNVLEVIKDRNKIVHEGKSPSKECRPKIQLMLETVSVLLGEPVFRFPFNNIGDIMGTDEQWNRTTLFDNSK